MKSRGRTDLGRRKFLHSLGVAAAALSAPAAWRNNTIAAQPPNNGRRFVLREDRFGRMFADLPPFAPPSAKLSEALMEMGKQGGILDAKDQLSAGAAALIVDPALNVNNANNSLHTAGTTFVGQFMDHDVTFDLTSRLRVPTQPEVSPNTRDPAFDLDSVYGGGPIADRELNEPVPFGQHPTKFKIESGGQFEDLPRIGTDAVIADPRNDENLIISGLHTAFLLVHNKVVDLLGQNPIRLVSAASSSNDAQEIFRQARRLTTWHYQ